MADVHLPLVGGVSKKALAIGGVASAAVVGLFLLRKRKGAAATPAAGQDPNAIDPATGLTYAEEAAGASTSDYLSPGLQDTTGGPTYGSTGYTDPNTGQWVYGNTGTGQAAATTNSAWAQNAVAYLSQNNGTDPAALSAALGAYLAGRALTPDQVSLADQAIAVEGYPPVAGAGGYPPGIREAGTPSQGGTGGSGGGVTGSGSGGGGHGSGRLTAPTGVHVAWAKGGSGSVAWHSVAGAHAYVFQLKAGGSNGRVVSGPFDVAGPAANFGPGIPRGALTALVWPSDPSDHGGPGSKQPHAELHFTMP